MKTRTIKKKCGEKEDIRFLKKRKDLPVDDLIHEVIQEGHGFCDNCPLEDDVTIVTYRVTEPFSSDRNSVQQ